MTSRNCNYITENMVLNFVPTNLYIKRHSITGMLYFGKTIKSEVERYLGSGKHWKSHIAKHGKEHVETLWSELFTDIYELNNFALSFSIEMDIVQSKCWANLIIENGMAGGSTMIGRKHSDATRKKMAIKRAQRTGKKHSEEHKVYMSMILTGRKHSDSARKKMSTVRSGSSWWNDGMRTYRLAAENIPEENWVRGRICHHLDGTQ